MRHMMKLTVMGIAPLVLANFYMGFEIYCISGHISAWASNHGEEMMLCYDMFCRGIRWVLLTLWGYMAYRLADPRKNIWGQAAALCAVGGVLVAVGSWQETTGNFSALYGYGLLDYFMFAPKLGGALLRPLLGKPHIFSRELAVDLCLLFAVAVAGCGWKRRKGAEK